MAYWKKGVPFVCSNCGRPAPDEKNTSEEYSCWISPFCPHCGEKMSGELFGNSKMLVKTKDIVVRENIRYEVVVADDNVFVVCPIVYDKKEKSDVIKYNKAEIYANQPSINTLEELRFEKWK